MLQVYDPIMNAEVDVDVQREDAVCNCFRLINDYTFGNNTVQRDIAMTSPVQQHEGQKNYNDRSSTAKINW